MTVGQFQKAFNRRFPNWKPNDTMLRVLYTSYLEFGGTFTEWSNEVDPEEELIFKNTDTGVDFS